MSCDPSIPLVSVVIPSFKHKIFIRAALQSVFEQTWSRIELILIDDDSGDGTLEEAALWASETDAATRFERVLLRANEKNLGAHATINKGCVLSSGSYIAVLNSDDMFHRTRIEKLFSAMGDHKAELSFSRVAPIDENGDFISPACLPPELDCVFQLADYSRANQNALSKAFLECNIAISTGNFLFTRELFEKVGPFANLKYVHDWDFALRSTLIAEPAYVPEDLYFYRIHGRNSFSALSGVAELESTIVAERYLEARRTPAFSKGTV